MRRVTLIKSAGPMYTTRERRVVVSLLNARRAVRQPISAVMVRPACLCLLLASAAAAAAAAAFVT